MAKARARTTARKVKDKWKAKQWYTILASSGFNGAPISETPAETPEMVVGRVASTTMQDLTGDFKLMHIKLDFQVVRVNGTQAEARFIGHSLTTDYVRRLVRRNHTKVSTVVDAMTKDGATVRVKPFAVSDRRCQSSQQRVLRKIMQDTVTETASQQDMESFIREMLDGRLTNKMFKATKLIYPLRKVEINRSEVRQSPTITLEQIQPATQGEAPPPAEGAPATPPEAPSPEEGGPEPAPEPVTPAPTG